jgi:capsular polysaccharide biosynthesis protein
MNSYVRAALRMWWLVLIGVLAGGYVAVHVAKRHKPPTYGASAQLMVDSTERPFLRTGITQTTQGQPGGTKVKTVPGTGATVTTTTPSQPTQSSQQEPNTQILVQAANLYPILVTSDPVTALRQKVYGDIQGTVTAKALYANAGVVRFTPSQFPIIEIDTVSKTDKNAQKLANTTALTLRHWVTKNQRQGQVPKSQRIVLRPLKTATTSVKQTNSRLGLALLVGAGVLAVFYALAVVLDLLVPSRRRKQSQAPDEEKSQAVPSPEA